MNDVMQDTLLKVEDYYKQMIDGAVNKLYEKAKYEEINEEKYITPAELIGIIESLGDEIERLQDELNNRWEEEHE